MSSTNYDYNVTFWDQWDYFYSTNKTGFHGYHGEVMPTILSKYISYIAENKVAVMEADAVLIYACLVTLGLIGNVVNIVVFTRPSIVGPLNFLLTCLESVNLVNYINCIPFIALQFHTNHRFTYEWQLAYDIIGSVNDAVIFMSNWCNVTIGLFRFIAVTWPLFAKKWCSNTRAKLAILVIGLASVTVGSVSACLIVPTPLRVVVYENVESVAPLFFKTLYTLESIIPFKDRSSEMLFSSILLLFMTSIPCFISALFTLLLIRNLCVAKKRRRRLQENGVSNPAFEMEPTNENPEASRGNTSEMNTTDVETRLTIALLVVLVFSNLPMSIFCVALLTGDQSIVTSKIANMSLSTIAKLGVILSNCFTFFVYVTMIQHFRKTLVDLVRGLKAQISKKKTRRLLRST